MYKNNKNLVENQLFDENFFFKQCGFANEEKVTEYLTKVYEELYKWRVFES